MPKAKSNPVKSTKPAPLFTVVDFDNLEMFTNLTEAQVTELISQVLEDEHETISDLEMVIVLSQRTGLPYGVELKTQFKLVLDESQPQFRKKKATETTKTA